MSPFDWIALSLWFTPGRIALLLTAVLGAALVVAPLAQARMTQLDRRDLPVAGLPSDLDGLRIVFVADVHAGPYFSRARVARLVEVVNEQQPDVVLLGGDYVGGRMNGARSFYPEIAGLSPRCGTFAVLGNHDVWEGADEAREGMRAAGIEVLENSNAAVPVGDATLWIAGLDDLYTGDPDVRKAAEDMPVDPDAAILLSHNPDAFIDALPDTGRTWDLALAGHTHGGQVALAGQAAFVPSEDRYRTGWLEEYGVPILVSNGIGTVTLPIRNEVLPQVHVITLRPE